MERVYLVGMMGAGKSTVGKLLARLRGAEFFETDEMIKSKTGKTIEQIFETEGEARFRKLEREALGEISEANMVVSTGGGIVLEALNRRRMKESGLTVYLRAKPETLWRRVKNEAHRPLLKGKDPRAQIQKLLREREAWYEKADFIVDTDGKKPEQIAREIAEALERSVL